jgi:hypothetical protein
MEAKIERKESMALFIGFAVLGTVFGLWAFSAFTSLFVHLDWSLSEVLRQYMVATGALAEQETLVDYYTHIKGAEYIIAVAFLGLYPVFYKFVNRTKVRMKA